MLRERGELLLDVGPNLIPTLKCPSPANVLENGVFCIEGVSSTWVLCPDSKPLIEECRLVGCRCALLGGDLMSTGEHAGADGESRAETAQYKASGELLGRVR